MPACFPSVCCVDESGWGRGDRFQLNLFLIGRQWPILPLPIAIVNSARQRHLKRGKCMGPKGLEEGREVCNLHVLTANPPMDRFCVMVNIILCCLNIELTTFLISFVGFRSSNHRECNTSSSNSGDHKTPCTKSSCKSPGGLYNCPSTTRSDSPTRNCYAGSCCPPGQSSK